MSLPPLRVPDAWIRDKPVARKRPWKKILLYTIGTVVYVIVVATIVVKVLPLITGRPVKRLAFGGAGDVARVMVLAFVVFPIVLFVHEGGHTLGGLSRGWRLRSMFIGPLRLFDQGGRLRIRLNQVYALYFGAVLLSPDRWPGDERLRRDFRRLVACGPLASLMFGGILLAVVAQRHVPVRTVLRDPLLFPVFVGGIMSIGIGLATLIPVKQGGQLRNDGFQLWALRARDKNGPRPLDPVVRDACIRLVLAGHRPRDWDENLLEQLARLPEDARHDFAYYRMLDARDELGAAAALERMAERVAAVATAAGAMGRRTVAVEAAIFEAAWRGDVAAARRWRELVNDDGRDDPHGWWLMQAAIAEAAGDASGATDALERADMEMGRRAFVRLDLLRAAAIERIERRVVRH